MNQRRRHGGFSLLQMVFTIVVLGVLAKFAIPKLLPAATMTLQPQAQGMRDVIRRAQSLAMTRGQRMRVTVSAAASSVSVACASGTPPCSTDASFIATQGVRVGSSSPAIDFNTLGQPVAIGSPSAAPLAASAAFWVTYNNPAVSGCRKYVVTVMPNTGQVSQPQAAASTACP
jgi:type II secretory pathway pseudopilin PulG